MKARFLALAALVLGLASCQQEFNGVAQLGGEVDFQLKVDAAELATRADADADVDGDGNKAANSAFGAIDYLQGVVRDNESRYDWNDVDLRYSLEVYDADADYSNTTDVKPVKDRMVKIVDAYEPVVFDLRLVPGRNYHFVVFADFVPQGATVESTEGVAFTEHQSTLGIHHNIGSDLRSIQIKDDAINDERCDAYFATTEVQVKHQALTTGDIVLQRPYGKLRVIATDLAELNLNVDPAWVEVTYTAQHPQHFNAVTGDVTGFVDDDYYFSSTYNELFKDVAKGGLKKHFYGAGYDNAKYYSTKNADGVERHTHMTLFTDYILGSNTEGEQTPVQFTMTVYDKANNPIKTTQFNTTIPIERNHLTTIVGNVLTSATEITVTIDDNFANADEDLKNNDYYQVVVTDGYELVKAAMEQYKVIMDGDITLTAEDFEKYNDELPEVLFNTRAGENEENTTYSFPNGTQIDLNGYTLTIVNNTNEPLIVVEESLNIIDTSKEGTGAIVAEGTGVAIQNNGTLNVEGVKLESESENGTVIENNGEANIVNSTLNNGALTNNGEANIAGGVLNEGSVENNGMTNVNGVKDEDFDENAITNSTNATVGSYIKDATGLQKEIEAAGKIGANNVLTLDADIVGNVTILQQAGVNLTIDGNGHKFDGVITVNGDARANGTEKLTIMGINFETEKSDITFISAPSKINNKYNYSHYVTIENCTFKGNHTVGCASFTGTYNFVMKNCTADNVHSIAQLQSVDNTATVESVTVRNSKNGLSFGNTAFPTIKNSTIVVENYGVRGDGNASRGNLVIENTTIVAATPVVIRKVTTDGYNVELKNPEKLAKNGFYHVVFTNGDDDKAYAAPATNYSIKGADNLVVFPYTWEVKSKAEFDQALASPATSKITFGSDITGNLTVVQKPNVKLTIDGNHNNLKGYITVDGKSESYTTAGLTLKNIYFNDDSIKADACIRLGDGTNATRYTCNVTAENCVFNLNGAVGVKSYTGGDKNLTIKGCTATSKAHSLVQAAGIDNIKVEGCNVSSKNGMNFNQSDNVAIDGCTVDVKGYAVRYGASSGTFNTAETYTISNSSLKSACEEEGDAVIVLRATADNATLTIENTTIEGTPEIINNAENATIKFEGYNYCAEGLYKDGVEYYVTNANGLATLNAMMVNQTAGKAVKVTLGADIDFAGKTWTPVNSHVDTRFYFSELDGNGKTISNFTINGQAMFTRFAGSGNVTIKNVTFDNAQVNSNGTINTSILTVQTYQNVLLDNVDVKNSTIIGGYKVAPLIATVYNEGPSTITATLKNCDVEDVTVKATSYDFCTTGMVAFVNAGDNDTITFENCSVKNVKLYAPNVYTAHAAIYTEGSSTLYNEAEGVVVENVTFENI